MRWKRMAVMLVGAGVVFGGTYAFIQYRDRAIGEFFANQPTPVVSVTAGEAEAQRWNTTIPTVGTLRAVNGVDVTPEVAGVVHEIMFRSGQKVSAGDPLVRLDSEIEQANMESAKAELDLAEANYERTRSLSSGVVSQATIDQNLYQMQARAAQVASLQAQIDKKTIVAPFDGNLGIRRVDIGQFVQPGTTMVNLQDLSTLLVEFSVSQRSLSSVEPGSVVRVVADADPQSVYEGEVTSVEPRVDPATGLVGVEATLPNPNGVLVAGMFVNVEVELADATDVVVVPQSAISYNLYGDFVYVIEPPAEDAEHPTVRRVVVEPGGRRDEMVVVESGVEAGERVVTSGQLRLSNGSQVDISDEPLGTPAVTEQSY